MSDKIYTGPLNISKMTQVQVKAYKSWKDQQQRCGNPRNPRFYCYGAIGIRREYSSRDFIGWYEDAYKQIPKKWQRVQCGRIDHAKNYTLDNIRLEPCSENTSERNDRHGNPMDSKPITATNWKTGEVLEFKSKREAAKVLNMTRNAIKNQLSEKPKQRKYMPRSGWVFTGCRQAWDS